MMTKRKTAALFLDISVKQDKLIVSISNEDTPFYQSEEIYFNLKEVESLCSEIRLLLNKSNMSGRLSPGLLEELKKVCLLLYDCLLSGRIKRRLRNSAGENLIVRMDEQLVFIPWELLYNGEDFICLAFSVGRRVITMQPLIDQAQRQSEFPLKMLILADPSADLPASQTELRRIRDQLDCNREVLAVSAKTGAITVDYVTRNIRDYDFIHFAGHTDHEEKEPSLDGWRLSDGRFSGREIQKMQGGSPFPLLIFLNSCRTADISSESVNDGYEQKCYGLVHAFLRAGIRHYIGTLWKIPDSVGLIIASEFYGRIKEGAAIGEALRQARRKAMKEFGDENIVWAGYVLYGDPKYCPFPRGLKSSGQKSFIKKFSRKSFPMSIGLLGILLVAGLVWFGSRDRNNFFEGFLDHQVLPAPQDHRLAVKALMRTADVNCRRGEYHAGILDYEKAAEHFAMIKTRQESDYFSLVIAYINLAELYALYDLDFNKAEESLNKIPPLLMTLKYSERWLDDKKIIVTQCDHFLEKLAASPYANSHMASQAKMLRKQFADY